MQDVSSARQFRQTPGAGQGPIAGTGQAQRRLGTAACSEFTAFMGHDRDLVAASRQVFGQRGGVAFEPPAAR